MNIINNRKNYLNIDVCNVSTLTSSQDLVITENEVINKNTNSVFTYDLDPSRKAVLSVKLRSDGTSTNAAKQIIMGSNINDLNNVTNVRVQ